MRAALARKLGIAGLAIALAAALTILGAIVVFVPAGAVLGIKMFFEWAPLWLDVATIALVCAAVGFIITIAKVNL
jgi:hypothetical protein